MIEGISAIIACDPKGVMGREGELPWHYPKDLEGFAATVRGQIIIMGSATAQSLPSRYFDECFAVVFTRRKELSPKGKRFLAIASLAEFLSLEDNLPKGKERYLIGGGQLCRLFLEEGLLSEVLLTEIEMLYEGDIFFPIELISSWPREQIRKEKGFTICRYRAPRESCNAD